MGSDGETERLGVRVGRRDMIANYYGYANRGCIESKAPAT